MNDERPDPDRLLARVERENAKSRRGKLKIFFGAAAGVGKTYGMLLAARERRSENIDVLVGLVEIHLRQETLALLEGLEVLPARQINYKGTVLNEFDIDAALARKPSIILVDELAHTNAPGSRHPKRWQDIHELLDAGIDVYTALNVQHLESLNKEVWQVSDRILVCIGANAMAERLVRAGKRLAVSLRAEWIVAYVETPQLQRLPAEKRDTVLRVLRLAEQLGAETVTLSAPVMSEALLRFSRERNINKIVVGKPRRRGWRRIILGSVVDVLINHAHNINIYLLGSPQREPDTESVLLKKSTMPGLRQRISCFFELNHHEIIERFCCCADYPLYR